MVAMLHDLNDTYQPHPELHRNYSLQLRHYQLMCCESC